MRDPQTLSPIDALQTLEPNFFIVRCGEIIKNIHTLHVRTFLHGFFVFPTIRYAMHVLHSKTRIDCRHLQKDSEASVTSIGRSWVCTASA